MWWLNRVEMLVSRDKGKEQNRDLLHCPSAAEGKGDVKSQYPVGFNTRLKQIRGVGIRERKSLGKSVLVKGETKKVVQVCYPASVRLNSTEIRKKSPWWKRKTDIKEIKTIPGRPCLGNGARDKEIEFGQPKRGKDKGESITKKNQGIISSGLIQNTTKSTGWKERSFLIDEYLGKKSKGDHDHKGIGGREKRKMDERSRNNTEIRGI